ncbi:MULTISPECIES: ATPase, T2SS/T4P/T4SS family [Haloarcula]|uniref:ATPase, T2SS/T4P/T4SS family n=1 Tax=Haloarcula TaxID=2237 RepID=UPI0023ECA285|nr:ATPase, T2SS/T4P/T4SS family [Halomicroarcula sp. XH51]
MSETSPGSAAPADCECAVAFDRDTLTVDASACPGSGALATASACRATVVDALGGTDVDSVVVERAGTERAYCDDAAALLVAAGRFATRVAPIDERVARRAKRDPLAAASEAAGRTGTVADLAAETGLALLAERADDYDRALSCHTGPAVSDARVGTAPPPEATLQDRETLETGAVARRYATPSGRLDAYHVEPREQRFDESATATLQRAHERLVCAIGDEQTTPRRAARAVCTDGETAAAVGAVLAKHTAGLGILEDLFADPRVSDVFATAPVAENALRVRVDGATRRTNVRLTDVGAKALASTFRRTSGRSFSRASPTLDATATVADRQIRVAGVTEPVSDGLAFAFRAQDEECWDLRDLVAAGSMPPAVAGLLSVAVERGSACLVAGPRGAGKTTLLGALLWELPRSVRTLVIEDTPELPVDDLQAAERDVQALRTTTGDGPSVAPDEALRTALRLGEGALVVGEVRGEEASVLYEAMRVGGGDGAVLGTIHGDGSEAVRERLVTDLGVPPRSFAATDLVVTLAPPTSSAGRGVERVQEVVGTESGARFETLYERDGATAIATGRLARGTSHLVDALRGPGESYESVLATVDDRTGTFECHRGEETSADDSAGSTP